MTNNLSNQIPKPRRSLWKPIGLTLLGSLCLGLSTCVGGFTVGKGPDGFGTFLLYSGLVFLGLFLLTVLFAVLYFLIWLVQKAGSR